MDIFYPTLTFFFYPDIIIFCNESFQKPMSFMELESREKKAVMESKNKLLDVLKDINLNQRYF